jgi:hypothetical protein
MLNQILGYLDAQPSRVDDVSVRKPLVLRWMPLQNINKLFTYLSIPAQHIKLRHQFFRDVRDIQNGIL